jgi:hypothetical protein
VYVTTNPETVLENFGCRDWSPDNTNKQEDHRLFIWGTEFSILDIGLYGEIWCCK